MELACALQYRLAEERQQRGLPPAQVTLVSKGNILSALAPYARKAFVALLQVSRAASRAANLVWSGLVWSLLT